MPQQRKLVYVGAAPVPPAAAASPLDAVWAAAASDKKRQTPLKHLEILHKAADEAFRHRLVVQSVPALDAAVNNGATGDEAGAVRVRRIDGSGPVQLILFSSGVLATLSTNPNLHGQCITFPLPPASDEQHQQKQPRIVDAAAGESHYLACDTEGRVYTWGWSNEYGQLGRGPLFAPNAADLLGVHEPVALSQFGPPPTANDSSSKNSSRVINTVIEAKVPHRICAVACGRHHSVLLTASRRCVFVFGRGHRGQLGLKDTAPSSSSSSQFACVDFTPSPRSVPALFGLPIAQLCCSSAAHHTIVVLESGHVIAMGENACGNLGVSADDEEQTTKTRATHPHCFVPKIVRINDASNREITDESDQPQPPQVSFPQLPRRMVPLIPPQEQKTTPSVAVCSAHASALHTALVDRLGRLFTAGAPPLRLQNGDQPVAAIGCLGRTVEDPASAARFGAVPEFFVDCSAGDAVVCGEGFTALLLRRHNAVFVSGAIQAREGSSEVSIGAGAEARSWLQLDLGHEQVAAAGCRVAQIVAAGKGLVLVVDS